MKLKYKILWIEDEKISIKIKAKNIQKYLEEEYGFECLAEDILVLDYEEFKEKYIENDEIKLDSDIEKFDLMLVDFNLGEEEHTGDKLIQIIRGSNIYSEILFYSSDLDSLLENLNSNFIDGVFTSVRDELEDKIKKLIKVTIKKVQDVNNLRGLIMAEVAELDRIKKRIIKNYNSHADANFKKYIKEKVFSQIREELENLNCLIKVEDTECSYEDINLVEIQKNFFYDTNKKSRTVFKIKKQKCNEIAFIHENYKKDIIDKRNIFAHEEEDIRDDGIKILKYPDNTDLEFTEEHCVKIRKDIKKYKKLLLEIDKKINE